MPFFEMKIFVSQSISSLSLDLAMSCSCEWVQRCHSEGLERQEWGVHADTARPRSRSQMVRIGQTCSCVARQQQDHKKNLLEK